MANKSNSFHVFDNTFEKVKGFLTEPSKTFDAVKGGTLGDAVGYYAVFAAIYSAIFALLLSFGGTMFGSMLGLEKLAIMMGGVVGAGGAIILFLLVMILEILLAFIGGAVLHILVYIMGGRKGIDQTIKAVMYGSTPRLLLGWIPIIGFLASIWSLVHVIIGIRQLHELKTGKAILAVVLPIILIVVIGFFAFLSITAPSNYTLSDKNNSSLGGIKFHRGAAGLEESFQIAQQENKPIMIYFWAIWSPDCTKFQTDTLGNPNVKKIIEEDYVLVAMDLDIDKEVAQQYGVSYPPYLIFMDTKGNVLERVPGAVEPEYLLPIVTQIHDNFWRLNTLV